MTNPFLNSRLFFGVLALVLASTGAAKTAQNCTDLIVPVAGKSRLSSAIDEMAGRIIIVDGSGKNLDHTVLGAEGQEIYDRLNELVVGHNEVKLAVAQAIQRAASGTKNKRKPIASFLFLGVTGTGKTLVAEALAEILTGSPDGKIKIQAGEYQHDHEIAKITGSPPGYVGHDVVPLVTEKRMGEITSERYKANVMLVDEIEKAGNALRRLLLGVMDDGTMTLGNNATVSFANTVVIMTSNLGQSEMQVILDRGGSTHMGFRFEKDETTNIEAALEQAAAQAVTGGFAPEFRNRITKTFVFKQHTAEEAAAVLDMNLALAQKDILAGANAQVVFDLTPAAREFILAQGYKEEFGGRSLRRAIEHFVTEPLSNLIGSRQILTGDVVEVDLADHRLHLEFRKVATGLSPEQIKEIHVRIYGGVIEKPSATTSSENPPAIETKVDSASQAPPSNLQSGRTFEELILKLAMATDEKQIINDTADYIRNGPLTDSQFLQLLGYINRHGWELGYNNGNSLSKAMVAAGLRDWGIVSFEPAILQLYRIGAQRLTTIKPENGPRLQIFSHELMREFSAWSKAQKGSYADPALAEDIDSFLQAIEDRILYLPSS